jgi:GNAT superfamily N-acetyltransferase
MQIRAAVHSDVPRLLSLVRRYWEFEDIAGFEALRMELLLQRLLKERALGEIWVAASGDELCGYLIAVCALSLEHLGLMAEIDEFYVVPQQRGTGVGAQLLRAAEAALAARGCVRLQLQLSVANEGARQFYERRGYRPRAGYQLLDKALA